MKRDLASAEECAERAVEAFPGGGRALWVLGAVRLEHLIHHMGEGLEYRLLERVRPR